MFTLDLDEVVVKNGILFFIGAEYIWDCYLTFRQYRTASRTVEVPPEIKNTMPKETFDKARLYMLSKLKLGFVLDTFSFVQSIIIIQCNILRKVWDYAQNLYPSGGEVITSCLWLFILITFQTLIALPLKIYNSFVIEANFGFNKQTLGFFIRDQMKLYFFGQIFSLVSTAGAIVTIKNGGDYFFVWLWVVACLISIIMMTIYPPFIAPLLDTFKPLPEGELREQIKNLASQLNFPVSEIYLLEGSKRSSHSNAYVFGVFTSERIVLYDTVLGKDGFSNEEILAILGHELGHWYHNHIFKNFILIQITLFLLFSGYAYLSNSPTIYKAFGFDNVQPVVIGLYALNYILIPYDMLLGFILSCMSRHFEFQADLFAVKLGKGNQLMSALIHVYKQNLGFPIFDPLYSAYHLTHPTLLERIKAIKSAMN